MASGNLALALTGRVDYESFPAYADDVLPLLEGTIVDRADGPDQRVWTVDIRGRLFWLAYDEFQKGVSLDPQDSAASALIPAIREKLLGYRAAAGE
jgi:hypothetical protein